MESFAFIVAGFVVGFIVGLTGVGGGSLMTPLLIFGFGIKPALAVGTDLLFAAATKAGGMVNFARQRIIPWRVVFSLSLGSVPAALLTLWVLHDLGTSNPVVQKTITFTLGIALMLTAAATLYKAIRGPRRVEVSDEAALELPADHRTALALVPLSSSFVLELDEYPSGTIPRPCREGDIPPGISMVSFTTGTLNDRLPWKTPPTGLAAQPYCGRRAGIIVGAAGEWIELIEESN